MENTPAIKMAALVGYAQILQQIGHKVEIHSVTGVEMKKIGMKAAELIFNQDQKDGFIGNETTFDKSVVNTTDIDENNKYYSGLLFLTSVSNQFVLNGRKTTAADAANRKGIGSQSYGTVFQAGGYDENNHIQRPVFLLSIRTEREETWKNIFGPLNELNRFVVDNRTMIVDQEKYKYIAFRAKMERAHLFLDQTM